MDRNFPTRRPLRLPNYDYASCGAYFLTVCTKNRINRFWDVNATGGRPPYSLSPAGKLVDKEIKNIPCIYPAVTVDKYCIMPDHIHLLLSIHADADGQPLVAPAIPRLLQQFKGSVSKQIGESIWQKSYIDHVIRDDADYAVRWKYIEENPLKYGGLW